jgi:glycosyltransferase involved in cell wall biosynthesis
MNDHRGVTDPDGRDRPPEAQETPAPPQATGRQRTRASSSGGARAVTVVIPTKDRPRLLQRSIRSALAQEDVELCVVVVDDGGEPGVAAGVVAGFPEVHLIRHDVNRGVSAARNTGLGEAKTHWVAFLDDDDYWAPTKLARQVRAIEASASAEWSCVAAIHVDEHGRPYHYEAPPTADRALSTLQRVGGIPGGGSGVLVSRELAHDVGGFDQRFSILADWDFYLRLGLRSPLEPVDDGLVAYFRHPGGMYYDPVRLVDELTRLVDKYSSSSHPLMLDYSEWLVQLLSMALRRRDRGIVKAVVHSDVARRATPAALVRVLVQRLTAQLRRRGRSAMMRDLPEGWLQHASER